MRQRNFLKISFLILILGGLNSLSADELEEAWAYFLKEKYNISENILDGLLKQGEHTPEVYYLKALLLLKRMRVESARRYFEELSFYGGKWAEYAFIGKADSYFLERKFKEASRLYSTFLKRYPYSDHLPEALYKYSLCLRKQGLWNEARESLQKLAREYPDSLSASYARRILQEDEFFFTIQVGSFLNYDNAYNLASRLKSAGFQAYIKKAEHKGKLYYRVRVGRFQTQEKMQTVLRNLVKQGFSPIVYP